jgi:hypothetical protein
MLTAVEPAVRIEVSDVRPARAAGQWRVTWRVHNESAEPLRLADAWVPHGKFRGTSGHTALDATVSPDDSRMVELSVTTSEPPGSVVRNAFLILKTARGRIFARMRIEFDDSGQPKPIVEQVTAQSIQ